MELQQHWQLTHLMFTVSRTEIYTAPITITSSIYSSQVPVSPHHCDAKQLTVHQPPISHSLVEPIFSPCTISTAVRNHKGHFLRLCTIVDKVKVAKNMVANDHSNVTIQSNIRRNMHTHHACTHACLCTCIFHHMYICALPPVYHGYYISQPPHRASGNI